MTARALLPAAVVLLVLMLAEPVAAEDFKLGIGGGATITTGSYQSIYKSGWNATARALWFPSSFFIGVRGAGTYGQNPAKEPDEPGTSVKTSAFWGVDANAAIRLTGKGAEGLYVDLGIGFRSLRQEAESPGTGAVTRTDSGISYNGGAGYSTSWFFVEASVVRFRVQGTAFVIIPVTVGVQF